MVVAQFSAIISSIGSINSTTTASIAAPTAPACDATLALAESTTTSCNLGTAGGPGSAALVAAVVAEHLNPHACRDGNIFFCNAERN